MCWAHVKRAVDRSEYLAAVRAEDKEVAKKIMEDLDNLQWTANNEETFRRVFSLLEMKHSEHGINSLDLSCSNLFQYLRKIWVDSEEFRYKIFLLNDVLTHFIYYPGGMRVQIHLALDTTSQLKVSTSPSRKIRPSVSSSQWENFSMSP